MRRLVLLPVLVLIGCGGDPVGFRPAKGASDQPALKESFRVKAVAPDCQLLGYITAEGDRALEDVAETTAHHGGNSFMIVNENRDARVMSPEGLDSTLVSRTNRKLLAEAYRCPMSGDLPH